MDQGSSRSPDRTQYEPWAGFAAAAPEPAAVAAGTLQACGFGFLGTIRRDGTPRISPVELHFVGADLAVVLIPGTAKARDLARDPRICLQSPIRSPADPGVEVKLRGRVEDVVGDGRDRIVAAVEATSGWRPGPSWRCCSVRLSEVAVLTWTGGDLLLQRWTAAAGVRPPERRQLDVDRGEYRRIDH